MRIPYVIDNQTHKLSDILNALLAEHIGHSLDVATAYFNVGAYRLLGKQLEQLRSLVTELSIKNTRFGPRAIVWKLMLLPW